MADDSITATDLFLHQKHLELEAATIEQSGDFKNCSYEKGAHLQPVYACLDCTAGKGIRAGICAACSTECHGDHNIIELWSKRNFRCDCGNSKFDGVPCTLNTEKVPLNSTNTYNHNYLNRYCFCDEAWNGVDEMVQCFTCQDWFHHHHLTTKPGSEAWVLVCRGCLSGRAYFLSTYSFLHVAPASGTKARKRYRIGQANSITSDTASKKTKNNAELPEKVEQQSAGEAKAESSNTNGENSDKDPPGHDVRVPIPTLQHRTDKLLKDLWLQPGWFEKLCRCEACRSYYQAQEMEYLLDVCDEEAENAMHPDPLRHVDLLEQPSPTFDLEQQGMQKVLDLPPAMRAHFASRMRSFIDTVKDKIRTAHAQGITEVTEEMVLRETENS